MKTIGRIPRVRLLDASSGERVQRQTVDEKRGDGEIAFPLVVQRVVGRFHLSKQRFASTRVLHRAGRRADRTVKDFVRQNPNQQNVLGRFRHFDDVTTGFATSKRTGEKIRRVRQQRAFVQRDHLRFRVERAERRRTLRTFDSIVTDEFFPQPIRREDQLVDRLDERRIRMKVERRRRFVAMLVFVSVRIAEAMAKHHFVQLIGIGFALLNHFERSISGQNRVALETRNRLQIDRRRNDDVRQRDERKSVEEKNVFDRGENRRT